MVLKLFAGTKFRKNGQKSRKSRNLIPWRHMLLALTKEFPDHCVGLHNYTYKS